MKKNPKLVTRYVPYIGEIGCGRSVEAYDNVIPFMPKNELHAIAMPENAPYKGVVVATVRGCSLSDFYIYDGDELVINQRFDKKKITEDSVCMVYIHPTNDTTIKRLIRGANKMILRASGGGIKDVEYAMDEIEIKGVVTKAVIDIDVMIARARERQAQQERIRHRNNRPDQRELLY